LVTKRDNEGLYNNMKNKYFFARFWQLTMVLTILTKFLVIFISKTRGLLLKKIFADDFNSPLPITSNNTYCCCGRKFPKTI
jgi:tetrahydromethanopterin S-methyltransferase subunit E